ncbi:MAG: type II toxin-antitoxin system Phd/YefM family antitoxin [Acidobacteria bacterium]|nr:type II toxin-antitoxin system Phd/YefM family antitoxin [Acidobacteriota bacterium]
MKRVTFTEFRKHASQLLTEVEKGEHVLVLRHGQPIATITPCPADIDDQPSWKRPGLRLAVRGVDLSRAILEDREAR